MPRLWQPLSCIDHFARGLILCSPYLQVIGHVPESVQHPFLVLSAVLWPGICLPPQRGLKRIDFDKRESYPNYGVFRPQPRDSDGASTDQSQPGHPGERRPLGRRAPCPFTRSLTAGPFDGSLWIGHGDQLSSQFKKDGIFSHWDQYRRAGHWAAWRLRPLLTALPWADTAETAPPRSSRRGSGRRGPIRRGRAGRC